MPSVSQASAAIPGGAVERRRQRQQELAVAAAAAVAAHGDRGFAAGQQHRRRRDRPRRRRGTARRGVAARSPACTAATSRASPSMRSLSTIGVMPRAQGRIGGGGERLLRAGDQLEPGRGEHRIAGFRRLLGRGGEMRQRPPPARSMRYFASTARASAKLVGSGTVGPEAITAGSSPGTSEIARVRIRAGAAAAASRPPLIAERCLRTVLISPIVAPQRSSARVTACLSARVRPGAGKGQQGRAAARDQADQLVVGPEPARQRRGCAAPPASPAGSGTGWLASTISMRSQATAWPWRVTTRPSSGPGQAPRRRAPSRPTPCRRRPRRCGPRPAAARCGGDRAAAGSAAARAASNKPRRNSQRATVGVLKREFSRRYSVDWPLPFAMPFHIDRWRKDQR